MAAPPALGDTFPLPPSVLKNLSDKSFEKRKAGAGEVEKIMRRLAEGGAGADDAVKRVLTLLATDFACNVNSNNRKGGLIALASCAIGLTGRVAAHLDLFVPAVLKSFADQEPRVRYYACESLFNIVKICRCALGRENHAGGGFASARDPGFAAPRAADAPLPLNPSCPRAEPLFSPTLPTSLSASSGSFRTSTPTSRTARRSLTGCCARS